MEGSLWDLLDEAGRSALFKLLMERPSVAFRPDLRQNFKQKWVEELDEYWDDHTRPTSWSAIYGDVVGQGLSPEEAMKDFDSKWKTSVVQKFLAEGKVSE